MTTPLEVTFELAPWRSALSRALHRNRAQPFCRFLQLATVRSDGSPANRTVVFRGFLESSNRLMFISDRRSEKIDQLHQEPQTPNRTPFNAEICWYFTKTREQFRISGQLSSIDASHSEVSLIAARQHLWQRISDSARLQFAWPHPKDVRTKDSNFEPSAPDSQMPPATFCLLLLTPLNVDYLSLRGEPQDRIIYSYQDADWTRQVVNP